VTIFSTAIGEGRGCPAPYPIPGDLCRPSGPDGEGQAKGQARRRTANLREEARVPIGRRGKNRAVLLMTLNSVVPQSGRKKPPTARSLLTALMLLGLDSSSSAQ
jgi:hypothetical protein